MLMLNEPGVGKRSGELKNAVAGEHQPRDEHCQSECEGGKHHGEHEVFKALGCVHAPKRADDHNGEHDIEKQ